jgi:protein-tyrosine phosphatase
VIDLHSHVLPGIDDGAVDEGESLAMAQVAAEGGITTIVATPHVRHDVDVEPASLAGRVGRLNERIAATGICVEIRPGGEVAASRLGSLSDEELRLVSLGGDSRYVLLEASYRQVPGGFGPFVAALHARGFRALIAHPERSPVCAQPELLLPLVRQGALAQVTAASLAGQFGARAQRAAVTLVRAGLVHVIASDAHRADQRLAAFAHVADVVERSVPEALARLEAMVESTPASLLADEDTRPDVPRSLPRRRRLRLAFRRRAG